MSWIDGLNHTLIGAIAMGFFIAGLFFLRFFRRTRDAFFLLFALSFFVEALNRLMQGVSAKPQEGSPLVYSVRLISYVLILTAILHKNGWFASRR